jgi:cyclic pyranopterin phosphate synthase
MPEEGMKWLPRDELLTYEELIRVAAVCVQRFGFESIRITGGEPTVRAHLPILIQGLADLDVDLAMTTNGATLAHQAAELAQAGLRRINISCDSLRPDRFATITRRHALDQVLAGIEAARDAGLDPVKVNCVVVLFSVRETDLRGILRRGGSDDDLAAAIEAEVGRKWAGHAIGQVNFIRPARSMSQIGG